MKRCSGWGPRGKRTVRRGERSNDDTWLVDPLSQLSFRNPDQI